jgi:hypothetical protein
MNTKAEISEIHVLFNGNKGGYDLSITYLEDGELHNLIKHCTRIEAVEATIHAFCAMHNDYHY